MTAPYTLKKLTDVEDSAAKFGFGEFQEARFAKRDFETERTGFSYQRIHPGKRQGFAHRHHDVEEVYLVLAGSGRMKLDDEVVEIERLDAIRVAPGILRSFEGGPDGLEVLAFGPRNDDDPGEFVQPGWSD